MTCKHIALATTAAIALSACAATTNRTDVAAAPAQAALASTTNTATLAPNEQVPVDVSPRDFGQWGYDRTAMDTAIRPGDDFDMYASGAWKARTEIPSDQSSAGVGWDIYKVTEGQLRRIISGAGPDSQLGALYGSFMDTGQIETLGLSPIKPQIDALYAISDKVAFTRFMGNSKGAFGSALVDWGVIPDPANPKMNILYMRQAGLGLPDRDYYLEDKFAPARQAYHDYLQRIYEKVGFTDPAGTANSVLAFETRVAEMSWPAANRRDIDKIYNPMTISQLQAYAPGLDWSALLGSSGITNSPKMIVAENTAIRDIAKLYADTPLPLLKAWQTAQVVHSASPYLADEFVQSRFQFTSALSGAKELRPRWTRGVQLVDGSLGELLGQTYVEQHFPPSSKAKMEELVTNLKRAMAARIRGNDWMEPQTKASALEKLDAMEVMVGYPDKFRDYSMLVVTPNDLIGNVARVGENEWAYERDKLGKPVDRSLWSMNPQTLNAYNGGLENKIVFPAGILQAPMFNPNADDAVNYGAIGAVIGHEITHGFDDQGRKIDKTGAIRDWWTPGDAERFEAKAEQFGAYYAKFEPVPGHFINPKLTMGENIADMAGLRIALEAYHLSLNGKPAPVIDGLTGDQRFFLAYAQAWQNKQRDESIVTQIASRPHSPPRFRVLGPLPHIDAWYEAFGIGPDSTMYIAPEDRVSIW